MARMPDREAYEALPVELRTALQDSVNDWDAGEVLKYFATHDIKQTIKWLRNRDGALMRETGFYLATFVDELTRSSYVTCRVKPLRNSNLLAA